MAKGSKRLKVETRRGYYGNGGGGDISSGRNYKTYETRGSVFQTEDEGREGGRGGIASLGYRLGKAKRYLRENKIWLGWAK